MAFHIAIRALSHAERHSFTPQKGIFCSSFYISLIINKLQKPGDTFPNHMKVDIQKRIKNIKNACNRRT